MKIQSVQTLICSGGWRPWMFVRIATSDGVVGYSECSDFFGSNDAILSTVRELGQTLVGQDPRPVERIYWDLYRRTRQSAGGAVQKAIAAIENALLDIKAKELGVPVYALLGGPLRDRVRLYWSHCGSTRVRSPEKVGKAPLRTAADVTALGKEVVASGYTALKTNLILLRDGPSVLMQGYRGALGSAGLPVDNNVIGQIDELIGTLRAAVGPQCDIMLDLNAHFRQEGNFRLADALEAHRLAWLEIDGLDPEALRTLRQRIRTPIATGENLFGARGYRPYLEACAQDTVIVDVAWNGFLQACKVANMAEAFDTNVAPHNHTSHLATLIAAHFCMAVANAPILEIDVDDVPWRDELVTSAPRIENGHLRVPNAPGWGADLVESVLEAHPWS